MKIAATEFRGIAATGSELSMKRGRGLACNRHTGRIMCDMEPPTHSEAE